MRVFSAGQWSTPAPQEFDKGQFTPPDAPFIPLDCPEASLEPVSISQVTGLTQQLSDLTASVGGSDGRFVKHTAAVALSGHSVVATLSDGSVVYASSDLPSKPPIGITISAVALGSIADVQISGEVTEPSWSWDVTKPVFLGINGALTQNPPATGMLTIVGYPTSQTSLVIELDTTVIGG